MQTINEVNETPLDIEGQSSLIALAANWAMWRSAMVCSAALHPFGERNVHFHRKLEHYHRPDHLDATYRRDRVTIPATTRTRQHAISVVAPPATKTPGVVIGVCVRVCAIAVPPPPLRFRLRGTTHCRASSPLPPPHACPSSFPGQGRLLVVHRIDHISACSAPPPPAAHNRPQPCDLGGI